MRDREQIEVLGIPVDRVTMEEALEVFAGFMEDGGSGRTQFAPTTETEMASADGSGRTQFAPTTETEMASADGSGRTQFAPTTAALDGGGGMEMMPVDGGPRQCHLIVTPNSEIVVRATEDPELAGIIRNAELVIPDGIGLVYASKILGQPLEERVTGIDFLNRALGWLAARQGSVYLLGSKPGVAEAAAEKMKEAFPGLRVLGTHHGYFAESESAEVAAQVRAQSPQGPDLLCVAMGAPRQEKFMATHAGAAGARAAIGVGGSLDVWAGTVKRAPEFYRKHGLEWLYRILKQPSRIKRSAALPLFMLRVLCAKKRSR